MQYLRDGSGMNDSISLVLLEYKKKQKSKCEPQMERTAKAVSLRKSVSNS